MGQGRGGRRMDVKRIVAGGKEWEVLPRDGTIF